MEFEKVQAKLHGVAEHLRNLAQRIRAGYPRDESDLPNTHTQEELKDRRLAALDDKIDQVVYQLYGLSAIEIGLIETGLRSS